MESPGDAPLPPPPHGRLTRSLSGFRPPPRSLRLMAARSGNIWKFRRHGAVFRSVWRTVNSLRFHLLKHSLKHRRQMFAESSSLFAAQSSSLAPMNAPHISNRTSAGSADRKSSCRNPPAGFVSAPSLLIKDFLKVQLHNSQMKDLFSFVLRIETSHRRFWISAFV